MITQAIEKLDQELKGFKGNQKASAISKYVAKTLKDFCKVGAFAAAVAKSKKTLKDCCEEITKGSGNHISDIEVYRKAAQFYFPGAVVSFKMEIQADGILEEIPESIAANSEKTVKPKKQPRQPDDTIQISLFDLEG